MTGSSVANDAAANDYLGIFEDEHGDTAAFGNQDLVFGPTPRAGTIQNLRAQINTVVSGGHTWTITVHAGAAAPGAATAVTCGITGAALTCNSGVLNAAVPAGSYITVRVTRSSSSASAKKWRFSFEY